ncbi:DUF2239 family protein [Bryobacter aggregatus]|uniref:DUF2239 family protein n=1 Tax=Bryobacter aggregatus TaxID=360054 RepID=UPI0004E1F2B2|nr:DUF2239 family protein [Bryobacter aggregatus]
MQEEPIHSYTVFQDLRQIASGNADAALQAAHRAMERGEPKVLIFNDQTGETVEAALLLAPGAAQRGPGRPKLGVVAREVTLLPRHWEWLNAQPGGASVALRKLVEDARKVNAEKDRARLAREAAYRFLNSIAANLSGYEEALRALFAGNQEAFELKTAKWPKNLRAYALKLSADGWSKG